MIWFRAVSFLSFLTVGWGCFGSGRDIDYYDIGVDKLNPGNIYNIRAYARNIRSKYG